jgi:broad specificity phosphatase PhoE
VARELRRRFHARRVPGYDSAPGPAWPSASDGSYDENTPLTELGHRQATQLADALAAGTRLVVVYSSPYPRALETATPLCQQLVVRPSVDPRLAEFQLGTGSFESIPQRPDLIVWRPEHRGVEHGETLGEFSARVAAFRNEVVERHVPLLHCTLP